MATGDQRSRLDLLHDTAAARAELGKHPGLHGPVWRAADHLVTLTTRDRDRDLLAARFGTTGRDPFLWLAARAETGNARRMVSALLLRLATDEDLPAALIIDRRDPVMIDVIRQLASTIPGAMLYPVNDQTVIPLRTAAMARRISRSIGVPDILVLDLRSTDEAAMTPVMTRLRRARAG